MLSVSNGILYGTDSFCWYRDREGFDNLDEINEYFAENDEFKTKFELVED